MKHNHRHGKWPSFLQEYTFVIKHKSSVENKVADSLSWVVYDFFSMAIQVVGFDFLKRDYNSCKDFSIIYVCCLSSRKLGSISIFFVVWWITLQRPHLCIPNTSLQEPMIWELHSGGAYGHFGRNKTIAMTEDHFYWPSSKKDVVKNVSKCRTCQLSKGGKKNIGLYMSLLVPYKPWQDLSMDCIFGSPKTFRGHDSIFVMVDHFSKTVHFIPCSKTLNVVHVAKLFFKEIVRLQGLPKTIVSNQDANIMSYFWRSLRKMLNTKLKFSSAFHPQTDSQIEVVNRSLGDLLHYLVGEHVTNWDQILPMAGFAYNSK